MRHRDGYVQITAHYTKDLERIYRVTAHLRRREFRLFRALGVLLVLLAALGEWSAAFLAGHGGELCGPGHFHRPSS
jgi:uncharacterized membrane protein YukC